MMRLTPDTFQVSPDVGTAIVVAFRRIRVAFPLLHAVTRNPIVSTSRAVCGQVVFVMHCHCCSAEQGEARKLRAESIDLAIQTCRCRHQLLFLCTARSRTVSMWPTQSIGVGQTMRPLALGRSGREHTSFLMCRLQRQRCPGAFYLLKTPMHKNFLDTLG